MLAPASQRLPPSWDYHMLQCLQFTKNGKINKESVQWQFCFQRQFNERGQRGKARLGMPQMQKQKLSATVVFSMSQPVNPSVSLNPTPQLCMCGICLFSPSCSLTSSRSVGVKPFGLRATFTQTKVAKYLMGVKQNHNNPLTLTNDHGPLAYHLGALWVPQVEKYCSGYSSLPL